MQAWRKVRHQRLDFEEQLRQIVLVRELRVKATTLIELKNACKWSKIAKEQRALVKQFERMRVCKLLVRW